MILAYRLIQWQNDHDVSIMYLIYRWLSAIWFLAVLSCSLLDIGRGDEPRFENHYAKWWIDLTNWGLVVCSVQAWLGAMIVTQGLMVDRDDFGMSQTTNVQKSYYLLFITHSNARNLFNFIDVEFRSFYRHATQSKKRMDTSYILDIKYHCHRLFICNNIFLLDDAAWPR